MSKNLTMTEEQYAAHQRKVKGSNADEFYVPRKEKKRSKYGNVKTVDDEGIVHDSGREARRWRELRTMLRGGAIAALGRQVGFRLTGGVIYWADFVYIVDANQMVVEDAKGVKTKDYQIKKKLMREVWGIQIKEV